MGKEEVENALIPTHCIMLTGTRTEPGEDVMGMIETLEVSIQCGTETDSKWRTYTLRNVLVVNALPVPIHISLEALNVYPKNQNGRLQVDIFPPKFHTHPYWDKQLQKQFHYVGSAR